MTSIVLALALAITYVVILGRLGSLHGDIGTLKEQQAQRQAADARAQALLRTDFQQADLPGKLAKVRDLTTAAGQALLAWGAQTDPQKPLNTVQDAINKCDLAIFDYDATAAQFPTSMLAGLPTAIDTSDHATDCGRLT